MSKLFYTTNHNFLTTEMKQTRWYVMIDPDGVISYFEKLNRHQFGQKYWFHNKYVNSFALIIQFLSRKFGNSKL